MRLGGLLIHLPLSFLHIFSFFQKSPSPGFNLNSFTVLLFSKNQKTTVIQSVIFFNLFSLRDRSFF